MKKQIYMTKKRPASSYLRPNDNSYLSYLGATLMFLFCLLLVLFFCPFSGLTSTHKTDPRVPKTTIKTFYDDPELSYSIEKPIKNWDDKRQHWLHHHPSLAARSRHRVLMVTGSQPNPCENPVGDHFLLRLFKNKVDYCRIHGYDVVYDDVFLHPKMNSFWAKYPYIKAAMVAHPEVEWIWWVDSDVVITDMEFGLPLWKYDNYSLVVHGWADAIFKYKSWTGLNAGVFLIRNCQWSLDFIQAWANMGPMSEEYHKWGRKQKSLLKDKLFPESDDQAALIYLLYKNKSLLVDKVYLESEYLFQGFWKGLVPTYDNVTDRYTKMEREEPKLRRRHAEKVSQQYGAFRGALLEKERRPFITHFAGCQPCRGGHNRMKQGDECWNGMVKALNLADNQVLRNYGFVHPDLLDSETVWEI